jgi:hypothetical protein
LAVVSSSSPHAAANSEIVTASAANLALRLVLLT